MRNLLAFCLVFFTVCAYCDGLGGMRSSGGGKASKYDSPRVAGFYGGGYGQYPSNSANETTSKPQPQSKKGIGISAWGIIAVVISVIMFAAGVYYFIIFYPLVCKKERNYDVIELSPV